MVDFRNVEPLWICLFALLENLFANSEIIRKDGVLIICMHVQSLSCVQLCATPWTVAHQAPLSVHGILQARILEWVAMPSSRGPSRPRDQTCISYVSCIGRWVLYH